MRVSDEPLTVNLLKTENLRNQTSVFSPSTFAPESRVKLWP